MYIYTDSFGLMVYLVRKFQSFSVHLSLELVSSYPAPRVLLLAGRLITTVHCCDKMPRKTWHAAVYQRDVSSSLIYVSALKRSTQILPS